MYVQAHFSNKNACVAHLLIESENKVVVQLYHKKYIDRCSGNNME